MVIALLLGTTPSTTPGTWDEVRVALIYEPTLKSSLSESMEIQSDNKSIKIRLRKNVVFHTGDPVTAHDVKFTYEQEVNPRNANMISGPVDEIEEIEVIDNHALIIHFYESYLIRVIE